MDSIAVGAFGRGDSILVIELAARESPAAEKAFKEDAALVVDAKEGLG